MHLISSVMEIKILQQTDRVPPFQSCHESVMRGKVRRSVVDMVHLGAKGSSHTVSQRTPRWRMFVLHAIETPEHHAGRL